ncbi:hypothetical protein KCU90_g1083, partial [Aureobasidium melanogenum]
MTVGKRGSRDIQPQEPQRRILRDKPRPRTHAEEEHPPRARQRRNRALEHGRVQCGTRMGNPVDGGFAYFVHQRAHVVVTRHRGRRIRHPARHALRQLHLEVTQPMRADRAAKARDGRLGHVRALRELSDARAHRKVDIAQHHVGNFALGGPQIGHLNRLQAATRGSDQPASTLRIEQMNMAGRQTQRDPLAGLDFRALASRHAPRAAAYFPVQVGLGASRLDHFDFHRGVRLVRHGFDMFGPDTQRDLRAGHRRRRRAFQHDLATVAEFQRQALPFRTIDQHPFREIHRRRAEKTRDEEVCRMIVQFQRTTDLLDPSRVHHDDAVGHRHRFDLIVRDVDHRILQTLMQRLDLRAHLHAQFGVEIGQRFVEQKQRRLAHHRTAHRHPLTLTTRERARQAIQITAEVQHLRGGFDPRLETRGRLLANPRPERDVFVDRQMRIERVALEHHRYIALLRRKRIRARAADHQIAAADFLEPRDHPHQGALAATRWADQHDELAVIDVEIDAVHHLRVAIAFEDAA